VSGIPERQALQPERTALAWQRTALTSLMLLPPVVVVAARVQVWEIVAGGSVAAVVAAPMVLGVRERFTELHDDTLRRSPFPMMVRVAAVTIFGAVGGLVMAAVLVLGLGH
jgi:uncharacterized membrane protein YidH (DUF202 family)